MHIRIVPIGALMLTRLGCASVTAPHTTVLPIDIPSAWSQVPPTPARRAARMDPTEALRHE